MAVQIGDMFHVIHMYDELKPLDEWYDKIFAVKRSMHGNYSEVEKRDASLAYIADFCMEPMAPSYRVEGAETMPVGRFHGRFGNRLHSVAWYVDDGLPELFDNLKGAGVRLFTDGGGPATSPDTLVAALFTHPRDTGCQWELMPGRPGMASVATSTANIEGYDENFWRDEHPLGIIPRAWHITMAVSDLEKGKNQYINLLGGKLLHEEENPASNTRSAFIGVGTTTVIEVATSASADSLLAQDLEKNGDIIHSVTWGVKDVKKAADFLKSNGVGVDEKTADTFLMNPDDTFGAVMYISQRRIPNDTRS
jgi:catechol 2,3-dioxygenase-like lactoylglutathione lyase family enzyme